MPVFQPYGNEGIEPEKGKICNVVPIYALVFKMRMYEPQSTEYFSSEGIVAQLGNKNSLCITNNYMADVPAPVCKNPYLATDG